MHGQSDGPFYQRVSEVSIRRKRHEPIPPESLDEPLGPLPEGYRYRCPVCSEERLVNEAIRDVAIGAAQFRGAYRRGMPTSGCPGCNGETMEYITPGPKS